MKIKHPLINIKTKPEGKAKQAGKVQVKSGRTKK